MRCEGKRTATNETCGSPVYRCKDCQNEGCNQGSAGTCTKQGFHSARCQSCKKIGSNRMIKDAPSASPNG